MLDIVVVDSGTQCYENCQAMASDGCVAFAYSPADSEQCDLYRGGPYTYGTGDSGSTCYLMQIGIFHLEESRSFLFAIELQVQNYKLH